VWLNDQPILWTVAIFIMLVGAVYFILVQRTKRAHLQAPEGAVFAEDTPLAAPASTA
jgi:cbb3-type cytochrome oxidase subunit 3